MKLKNLIIISIVIMVVFVIFIQPIIMWSSSSDVVFTVKKLERITTQDDSYYLVYTEEGEVFKNIDSLIFFKFDSYDVQGKLTEGQKYVATVAGFRITFLSSYRNIIEIK